MLEVSGIRIPLSTLDGTDARELAACRRAVARKLRVGEKDLGSVESRRRSIDARKRGDVDRIIGTKFTAFSTPQAAAGALTALTKPAPAPSSC